MPALIAHVGRCGYSGIRIFSRLAVKFYRLLAVLLVTFLPSNLSAQANLNPPSDTEFEENFEDSFDTFEIEEPETSETESSSSVLGTNGNGEVEYSVLENKDILEEPILDRIASAPDQTAVQRPSTDRPPSKELDQLLTKIVLSNLPHEYVQDKKWGQKSKRWAGVRFRRDDEDSKLETKRRFKMVNHGTWQKYSAELVDPENQFNVQLGNVAQNRDGQTTMDIGFNADLKLDARQAKWVKGVQLYSLSAEGTASVQLVVSCDVGVDLDFGQFPPDLILKPVVRKAKLNVEKFKLDRVSKAGGEVAQQVSKYARKELDARIAEKEKKLVKKLNQEIAENEDKLRLSIADAIGNKWFDQTKEFLPADVKNAISGAVEFQLNAPESRSALSHDPQNR